MGPFCKNFHHKRNNATKQKEFCWASWVLGALLLVVLFILLYVICASVPTGGTKKWLNSFRQVTVYCQLRKSRLAKGESLMIKMIIWGKTITEKNS